MSRVLASVNPYHKGNATKGVKQCFIVSRRFTSTDAACQSVSHVHSKDEFTASSAWTVDIFDTYLHQSIQHYRKYSITCSDVS